MTVQGYPSVNGTQTVPSVATGLDVSHWALNRLYRNEEVTHSGSFGAILRRRVGLDYQFRANVPWMIDNPPDVLLESGNSVSLCLWFGAALSYPNEPGILSNVGRSPINKRRCYFSPSALLDRAVTITDSTGTKIIRQEVEGSGNSLVFLLPDESVLARMYLQYLGFTNTTLPTDLPA